MYNTLKVAPLLTLAFLMIAVPLVYAAPIVPTQGGSTGKGGNTLTFGCSAYLIGPGGAKTAESLVRKMNKTGPFPILYTLY